MNLPTEGNGGNGEKAAMRKKEEKGKLRGNQGSRGLNLKGNLTDKIHVAFHGAGFRRTSQNANDTTKSKCTFIFVVDQFAAQGGGESAPLVAQRFRLRACCWLRCLAVAFSPWLQVPFVPLPLLQQA